MSFDNTKYDLELNGIPHRIKGYTKGEAPAFVPRVGSGSQSETEFNSLLSKTLESFDGGCLQRFEVDNKSFFGSEGLYPVYDDGVLYPVEAFTTSSGLIGGTKAKLTAKCSNSLYLFISSITLSAATNSIRRIDTSGTSTTLTLPANISSGNGVITDMVIWNNELWISWADEFTPAYRMARMPLTSTTVTEIDAANTSISFGKMVVWGNQLYGTNYSGAASGRNSILYRYTGTTSVKTAVELGRTPNFGPSYANLFIYNNRIVLTRNDGMFGYDGTRFVAFEDLSAQVNERNFNYAQPYKGYVYYFMPDGFYRYNGSLIEKLYDISEIGFPVSVTVGANRLWLLYSNSQFSVSTRYDKAMGYDYSSNPTYVNGRLMVFNGKGLYTYQRTAVYDKVTATEDFAGQGEPSDLVYFNSRINVLLNYEKTTGNLYYYVTTNDGALTGNKAWQLVTSIFDADFPMVDKNLDNIEIVFDGNVSSDQTITIEYRTGGFDGSTGWSSLGSFLSQTRLKEFIWRNLPAGIAAKKIQLRFSGTTAATYGIARVVRRYTLAPELKWQWQFTVLAYGDDPTAPLMLADGTQGTQAVDVIRGNIYSARSSAIPVKMIDQDQLDLNGAINAAVTTVVLGSTSLLKGSSGFVQIDDEIMYWSAKTSTNLTVIRGVLGTSAASHADNAKVFIVYRVLVTQVNPERIISPDNAIGQQESKSRATEITLQVREI